MAQGSTKGLQKHKESSRHGARAAANTKKGRRAVPPKKPAAVKQAALHKVRTIPNKSCRLVSNVTLVFIRENREVDRKTDGVRCVHRHSNYHEERRA